MSKVFDIKIGRQTAIMVESNRIILQSSLAVIFLCFFILLLFSLYLYVMVKFDIAGIMVNIRWTTIRTIYNMGNYSLSIFSENAFKDVAVLYMCDHLTSMCELVGFQFILHSLKWEINELWRDYFRFLIFCLENIKFILLNYLGIKIVLYIFYYAIFVIMSDVNFNEWGIWYRSRMHYNFLCYNKQFRFNGFFKNCFVREHFTFMHVYSVQ